jgi:GT2 family glycosyltransferase
MSALSVAATMLHSVPPQGPWLSVVVPAYNGVRYLDAALESIAAEHDDGIEVIVVDDCSTDRTRSLLDAAALRMPLQVMRNDRQLGWVATTNAGLRIARGEWVCTLHQDDVWMSGHVAALRAAARTAPGAGLIVGASVFIDDAGAHAGHWRLPWRGQSPPRDEVARRLYVQNFLAIPSTCVRADLVRSVGGLDEDLWYTADWDLWLKLVRITTVATARGALAGFRIHQQAQTISRSIDLAAFEQQLRVVQERHRWAAQDDREVRTAGEAALRTNLALAAMIHGVRPDLRGLAAVAITMRPPAWLRYFRDSRVIDRALPRARLRFAPQWRSAPAQWSPVASSRPQRMQRI